MKILHICLTGPYTDDLNYQENLLTKYQVKAGHDVYIIASQWFWGAKGKIGKYNGKPNYINSVGVHVKRLPIAGGKDIFYRYKRFPGFYEAIEKIQPEVIFIHNLQFLDVDRIKRYAKTHSVRIYADNHADFSNSARSKIAVLFYKMVWKHTAHLIEPYTMKFYGVLPARVEFLKDIYKLPTSKCELLVMGADDEEVKKSKHEKTVELTKEKFKFKPDDFIVVTGGKIDAWKKQTLLLMNAVTELHNPKVKLLIFGPVSDEIKVEFEKAFDKNLMRYVSWADTAQSYRYFAIADLVGFPGRHSVYWEQVVGQGKPMICKYWEGTTHIDIGGNVAFLKEDSSEEIRKMLLSIINDKERYHQMFSVANGDGKRAFSYAAISEKSIT